jgi:2-polyprenyl-6-methoxyphenol hydroxylase-like FAD-dependent oxidoreductase
MEEKTVSTTCCISGGGPAGIMLGFLLARAGVDVVVLEKWPDFFRDFRGDTIHPSTMQALNDLGLLKKFLALPHNETKQVAANIHGIEFVLADFSKLHTICPFLGFIPQWDFLNFIAQEARTYPEFHLLMHTEATDLIEEEGRVVGVKAKNTEGEFQIRAELVVGADGRHSMVREKSKLPQTDLGAPVDVLWFRLTRRDDGKAQSLGYIGKGGMMVAIDRDSYWQCAFIIKKGEFDAVKRRGMEAFRRSIVAIAPPLADTVSELTDWEQVKLLSVALNRLERWYKPGLICIGDAAHAMSPVGGVGINLAIQDAIAAARILAPAFKARGKVQIADLSAIQARRALPARLIQRIQVYIHNHVLKPALESGGTMRVPWQLRLVTAIPYMRRLPAYLIGIGLRPERIYTPAHSAAPDR